MQTLFQHYSLQPKPEFLWNVFDTNIYSNANLSLGLDHSCHAYILS